MKNTDKKRSKYITELSPCLIDLCNKRYDEIESLKGWSKNLESKIIKLEKEKDSLVQLANDRFDVIENLQEIVDQYTNEPKNKSLVDEVIKLKTENQKLKNDNDITQANLGKALKSSLSQIAYLVETVKTFDADFFKIKDFNK